ncbi:MAG: PTS sugar transporter subunit IIC [Caldisericaceae bacterium]|nr:PTS sugar transporter subunit IIC [Caldisericaceae bacterium]
MESVILLCAVAAILMLDNAAAFQMLLAQPIFAGPILGYLGGNLELGFELGFLLQLIWLSSMPVGAAIVPEGNFGSMAATILGIFLTRMHPQYSEFIVFLMIVYGILSSFIGTRAIHLIRKGNEIYLTWLNNKLNQGVIISLGRVIFFSLLFNALVVFIFFMVLTILMAKFFELFQGVLIADLNKIGVYSRIAILGSGIGMTATLFKEKKWQAWYVVGLLIGGVTVFYEIL